MKDRNVQHASRFRLTKVPGTDDVYDLIPAPGEVYEEGTLINKSALLKDETAALFGLDENAVPDEVLALLKTITDNQSAAIANGVKAATGSYTGTGTYGSSNPNSLTFDFLPKLVVLYNNYRNEGTSIAFLFQGCGIGQIYASESTRTTDLVSVGLNVTMRDGGKTWSWYSQPSNAGYQMNASDSINPYYYIAFG